MSTAGLNEFLLRPSLALSPAEQKFSAQIHGDNQGGQRQHQEPFSGGQTIAVQDGSAEVGQGYLHYNDESHDRDKTLVFHDAAKNIHTFRAGVQGVKNGREYKKGEVAGQDEPAFTEVVADEG